MFKLETIPELKEDNTQANRIKFLISLGLLPKDIQNILYDIRISRNDAVHNSYESTQKSETLLQLAYKLGIWFMQIYGNWNFEPLAFEMPEDTSGDFDFKAVIAVLEDRMNQLDDKIKDPPSNVMDVSIDDRRNRANSSAGKTKFSEEETRYRQVSPKQKTGETELKLVLL
ncbi:MAG TPA: hypothetical protein VFC58_00260 [Desulfosporosinus sp.]|nr:hypothetical protein [Desulfosporosinus sp.]